MKLRKDMNAAFRAPVEIEEIQKRLLREHVGYCLARSPYYKRVAKGINLETDASLADMLHSLPLTRKADLEQYNDDFRAVPAGSIVDIVMSSGTTGKPVHIAYTEHDLKRLAYNEEKSFAGCGMTKDDIVLLTCTLDRCFVAGMAYFLGVRNLGAAAIRNGHDTMDGYAGLIRRMKPTAVVGVPSFVRKLGRHIESSGLSPADTSVRRIVVIGEPVRGRDMRLLQGGRDIETLWDARVYSTYASSEIVTSFCECEKQQGGHLHPDLAIVEILDDAGKPLPNGKAGEITVTPLCVEGMPLLRFCTGDIGFLIDNPCACGRNSVRLSPILGRRSQMLKVKGTSLYPPAIQAVIEDMREISEYYIVAGNDDVLSDTLTVHVSLSPNAGLSAEDIATRLSARLRVKPTVCIDDETVLRKIVHTPATRKPIRFIDRRQLNTQGGLRPQPRGQKSEVRGHF